MSESEPLTREAAIALLTRPGSVYELEQLETRGPGGCHFGRGPKTLRELFAASREFGDRPFLVFEDERLSFEQTYARAALLAKHLVEDLGVQRGDRVALAMRNYPEWPIAYVAITSVGAVVAALNAWWTGRELSFGLRDSGCRVALLDAERFARVEPLRHELGCRMVVTRAKATLPPDVLDMADLTGGPIVAPAALPSVTMPEVNLRPEDDATILYTSGTSDDPKGAVSTHRAVVTAAMGFEFFSVVRALLMFGDDIRRIIVELSMGQRGGEQSVAGVFPDLSLLVNVPLFHVTGANTMLLPSFRSGRKLVLMRRWDADEAVRLIERERVTHVQGVPTMTWDLINSPEFDKRDTSSLVFLGAGGAAQPGERVKEIRRRGNVHTGLGYGMTETNALGSGISGDDYLARPDSVGKPFSPLIEARIIDSEGATLPVGETGEICLKTAAAIRGYWNRPQDTAALWVDGWVRTGDIGHIDAEGYLFISDRAKEIIIRGGENISCLEVEAVLAEHPAVHEVAVFGLADERLGEHVAAAIMVAPGWEGHVSEQALKAHAGTRLAAFKVPTVVWVGDEPLPRLASGKFDRRALRSVRSKQRL